MVSHDEQYNSDIIRKGPKDLMIRYLGLGLRVSGLGL